MISAYFAQIKAVIDRFGATKFVVDTNISFSTRPENQGYLRGSVIFIDYSSLHFSEYVDTTEGVEKLSYSYHYQDARNRMIFRYDNAAHKPVLSYQEHKHLAEKGITEAKSPSLEEVLTEITVLHGWA